LLRDKLSQGDVGPAKVLVAHFHWGNVATVLSDLQHVHLQAFLGDFKIGHLRMPHANKVAWQLTYYPGYQIHPSTPHLQRHLSTDHECLETNAVCCLATRAHVDCMERGF